MTDGARIFPNSYKPRHARRNRPPCSRPLAWASHAKHIRQIFPQRTRAEKVVSERLRKPAHVPAGFVTFQQFAAPEDAYPAGLRKARRCAGKALGTGGRPFDLFQLRCGSLCHRTNPIVPYHHGYILRLPEAGRLPGKIRIFRRFSNRRAPCTLREPKSCTTVRNRRGTWRCSQVEFTLSEWLGPAKNAVGQAHSSAASRPTVATGGTPAAARGWRDRTSGNPARQDHQQTGVGPSRAQTPQAISPLSLC